MSRPKTKKFHPSFLLFGMAIAIIIAIWSTMDAGGWPIDWRMTFTIMTLGILTGSVGSLE